MAVLIPFHFFHFHLNFHASDFFLVPRERFDYKDRFLAAWQEKLKTQAILIKDGQPNLYLLVDLGCNKIFYSV